MNTKTINNMKKMFREKAKNEHDTNRVDIKQGVMDPANVAMYVPKIKGYEPLMDLFEGTPQNVPRSLDVAKYHSCRYSKEYLKMILKTLIEDNNGSKSITISVGEGMPLIIEDENHGFILAPKHSTDSIINEWHDRELI